MQVRVKNKVVLMQYQKLIIVVMYMYTHSSFISAWKIPKGAVEKDNFSQQLGVKMKDPGQPWLTVDGRSLTPGSRSGRSPSLGAVSNHENNGCVEFDQHHSTHFEPFYNGADVSVCGAFSAIMEYALIVIQITKHRCGRITSPPSVVVS